MNLSSEIRAFVVATEEKLRLAHEVVMRVFEEELTADEEGVETPEALQIVRIKVGDLAKAVVMFGRAVQLCCAPADPEPFWRALEEIGGELNPKKILQAIETACNGSTDRLERLADSWYKKPFICEGDYTARLAAGINKWKIEPFVIHSQSRISNRDIIRFEIWIDGTAWVSVSGYWVYVQEALVAMGVQEQKTHDELFATRGKKAYDPEKYDLGRKEV